MGGATCDDELLRRRGRGGPGVLPAGICVGRQLERGEAISGEDLSV